MRVTANISAKIKPFSETTKFILLFRIIPNFYSPIDNSILTIIFVFTLTIKT